MKGCLFMFISEGSLKEVRSSFSGMLKRRDFFNSFSLFPYLFYHLFSYISNMFNITYDEDKKLILNLRYRKELICRRQEVIR